MRARDGIRTRTPFRAGGFKPPASAIPPPGQVVRRETLRPAARSASYAAALPVASASAPSSVERIRTAPSPVSEFADNTPSTMSASMSNSVRPCNLTATIVPPAKRRIERTAPGRRGGLRNAGTCSPAARHARPKRRAVRAKCRLGGCAIGITRSLCQAPTTVMPARHAQQTAR